MGGNANTGESGGNMVVQRAIGIKLYFGGIKLFDVKRTIAVLALVSALGFSSTLPYARQAPEAQPGPIYTHRAEHDPDGIGKFYMGREIAQVYRGVGWLERPERTEEEKPTLLIKALKIEPGQSIADIGAGTGYFTFPLAQDVGPQGKIFAVDIQPQMLEIIGRQKKERGANNVEVILGEPTDPRLPPSSVDLVLMVDVYHEFSHPWEMMQKICAALKPGGRVVFVEYRGEDESIPIKPLHKMTAEQVKRETTPHPLTWVKTIEVLPRQRILIFERKPH